MLRILIAGGILSIVATGFLIAVLLYNPRIMRQDYPDAWFSVCFLQPPPSPVG